FLRRATDGDMPVKAAGAEQGGIKNVGAIRGGEHNHEIGLCEAVHLAKDLVERLFALIVAAAEAGTALATDGVDLVDENDRRRVLLGRIEQIANAARADADEH